jgi:hypothetical protein
MKYCYSLIVVLLLSANCAFAQKEYKPAYIITNSYDTINGYVNINTDNRLPEVCLFRLSENYDPVKYTPDDLLGYRLINDKYNVTNLIPVNGDTVKKFTEFLINGIVNIYMYSSPDGVRYFAQKEGDNRLWELLSDEKEFYINETKYTTSDKKYVGTLKWMMRDAPELSNEIDNVTLGRKSLINISKDYHNIVCTDHKCITYEKN